MSSEQVAGILRQSSQQVRLVVARSIREPSTTEPTTNTPPSPSQHPSLTSETISNHDVSTTHLSLSTIADNETVLTNAQNKILLRTERLLENNHNLEKILENLREKVRPTFPRLLRNRMSPRERLIMWKTHDGRVRGIFLTFHDRVFLLSLSASLSSRFLHTSVSSLGHFLLLTLHHSRRLLGSRVFTEDKTMTGCSSCWKRACVCAREREAEKKKQVLM